MTTTELIEIARECCSYPVKVSDYHWCGEGEFIFTEAGLNAFAQRIEAPHKQRIEALELALQKQAKAALLGMDAAKANGDAMLKAATEIQSQLKPELLDSERQANAVLTEENEKLQQQIEQLREALQDANKHIEGLHGEFVLLREGLRQARFVAKEFIDSYEDLASSVGVFEAEKESIKRARRQLKALEWK